MNKTDIENYIEKLKNLENIVNNSEVPRDFETQIGIVLDHLNEDITKEMTKKVQNPPTLNVKFKKLDSKAVTPTYAKEGDAGLDITALSQTENTTFQSTYNTGIAVEIPEGYVGLLYPRSSIRKYDLTLSNSVGVIDSGYRGEIIFTFNKTNGFDSLKYKGGDRIGQLVILPYPKIKLEEVDELTKTKRNTGGFGHSGT